MSVNTFNMPASEGESRENTYFPVASLSVYIYIFFNMSLCLFIQDCQLSGGLASLQGLMHQGQVASKAAVIFLLSSHNSMGYPGEV